MANIEQKNSGNKGKVRSKKNSTRVDMAPFCDLGFLLITFFMFTTSFSKPNMMTLSMPAKPDNNQVVNIPELQEKNSLTIIIGGDNKLYWHQKGQQTLAASDLHETNYTKEGLRTIILEAHSKAPGRNEDVKKDLFTVVIKPTDDSNYQNLIDVLDEMIITSSSKYGITEITPLETEIYNSKIKK